MPSALGSIAIRGCAYLYGLAFFGLTGAIGVLDGHILNRPPRSFWEAVEKERRRIWNLAEQTPAGLGHAFHILENGAKIHYLTNYPFRDSGKPQNLVIFIHGWPDSCQIWDSTIAALPSGTADTTRLIAFDLPGHGGSDGIDSYSPDSLLDAVVEFVLAMREQYLESESSKVILVGHDWGALIGFRLAADAPSLADRFLLTNAGLPALARANIINRFALARRMSASWLRHPLNFKLLRNAVATVAPVVSQLQKSAYAFVFNLPRLFAARAGTVGNLWPLRLLAAFSLGRPKMTHSPQEASRIASTLGPPASSAATATPTSAHYGGSAQSRARASPSARFFESVRLYREGLATARWSKSLTTLAALHNLAEGGGGVGKRRSSSGAGLIEDGPEGALKAPTTVLWGEDDPAADARVMLEGMQDYLGPYSAVVLLPGVGHWTPVEEVGARALGRALGWALAGGEGSVGDAVREVCEGAKVTAKKL